MNQPTVQKCTAFEGERRIASGDVHAVALATREVLDRGGAGHVLIFDDATGQLVELNLHGTADEISSRFGPDGPEDPTAGGERQRSSRGRGRPKLGVVSKEVTLLPRHWAWLGTQRGGASATLRRLVDEARHTHERRDRVRTAQDTTYHFMWAMVGDQPGFEEAMRALYVCDRARFEAESENWPPDLRDYARNLAAEALRGPSTEECDP
jgi:hypothetical protein